MSELDEMEIERLRARCDRRDAEIARLRAALREAADSLDNAARWNAPWPTSENKGDECPQYVMMRAAAAKARKAAG